MILIESCQIGFADCLCADGVQKRGLHLEAFPLGQESFFLLSLRKAIDVCTHFPANELSHASIVSTRATSDTFLFRRRKVRFLFGILG